MKLDTTALRYLSNEDWRVLTAVEVGSKNHELVPTPLIVQLSHLHSGSGVYRSLSLLAKANLIARTKNAKYDGFRLTYGGLDYLALHTHLKSGTLYSTGNCIGTGKESDIYVCAPPPSSTSTANTTTITTTNAAANHQTKQNQSKHEQVVLKIHRLGRISFRTIKHNRDYLGRNRTSASWMYMSRLAAQKEFAFMKILHENGFPVPRAIAQSRHTVVMEMVGDGVPLRSVRRIGADATTTSTISDGNNNDDDDNDDTKGDEKEEEEDADDKAKAKTTNDPDQIGALYAHLLSLIVKLAHHGLIHGDFNEFNLLVREHIPLSQPTSATSTTTPQAQSPSASPAQTSQTSPPPVTIIDFPQMLSIDHPNADFYFDRDVNCIKTFFQRKFGFTSEAPGPTLVEVRRSMEDQRQQQQRRTTMVKKRLDVEVEASGFSRKMGKELENYMKEVGWDAHGAQSRPGGYADADLIGAEDSGDAENGGDGENVNESTIDGKPEENLSDSIQCSNASSVENG